MKSNVEWKKWGETDPLWAAASWDGKQKSAAGAWTDAEFYALGEAEWRGFSKHWKQYGLRPGHCVEIGCGPGRMTRQLVREFQKVTALDVSSDQIEYAKAHSTGLPVTFAVTDGVSIPVPNNSVEGIFSTHVFQHFDNQSDALKILKEAHRVLVPGGTLMIHLPLFQIPHTTGVGLVRVSLWGLEQTKVWKAAAFRKLGKLIMRTIWYEKSWLIPELGRLGFEQVEFRTFDNEGNGGFSDFVFATKRA